ncbi:MAG TPA: hypothetical protein VMU95_08970 [Trebonia sp.]|nr:hypothetical protein [Trebonia sp.]
MTSEIQGLSGTHFDPCPQFCVHQAEHHGQGMLVVIGRCLFGPIRTGMAFDGIAPPRDGNTCWPDPVTCRLLVTEAHLYGKPVDEINQALAARLILTGDVPACLAYDAVLIVPSASEDGWRLDGGLWRR